MKKRILIVVVIIVLAGSGYYLFTENQSPPKNLQEDKGYEYVQKVLDNVEPEGLIWINTTLYVKAGDVVYQYLELEELAQEYLQVNQNSTIGVRDNQLIICSWENRLIMSEEEFATALSIINEDGEELHSANLHETLKIDNCSEDTLTLSNAYPILKEVHKTINWKGDEAEATSVESELSLGGEENILVIRGSKKVAELPLINTVEQYSTSPNQKQIAFYTSTNQVWVINLSQ